MKRKDFERAVGDTTHAATDLGKEALATASAYVQQAQDYIAPRAQEALHQASDYLGPRAQDALHQAQDYITPLAKDAKKRSARLAADTMDTLQPRLDDALGKVTPAVDAAYARFAPVLDDARSKVQYELLPKLSEVLHEAAETAARIELPEVVEPPAAKRSVWGTLGKLLLAGGLVAGIVFALKKFLAPSDSGWQAHEPSTPYVPTKTETLVEDLTSAADDTADAATEWLEERAPRLDDTADAAADAVADASDDVADAAAETGEGDAAPFAGSPYGDGSFVGNEPPEGFSIKGNERSMKYHVPGNGGYERTMADVWFDSEASAEAAGFKKAQR